MRVTACHNLLTIYDGAIKSERTGENTKTPNLDCEYNTECFFHISWKGRAGGTTRENSGTG